MKQGRGRNQPTPQSAQAESIDTSSLRDEELLALVAQANSDALGTFYDRYGRLVFTVALRITGDRETAEEVTQDVFRMCGKAQAAFNSAVVRVRPG